MHPDLIIYVGLIMIICKDSNGINVVMAALKMGGNLRVINENEEEKIVNVCHTYFS